ncbi:MAG: type I secretion system permease/ATPase [Azonexus sp.]|nr:type I secretion system permease/ATPase [Azonexus sp.]MCK6411713.1 type I secretion system permease/ATPase [Azonexus sp.]
MKKLLLPKTELNEVLLSFKKAFYSAGIFSMFINMLGLIPSIYMLQVYDRVLQSRNETTLMMLTVILLGFYAILGMLEYTRSKLLVRVGAQIDQKLSERIFTASFESYLRRSGGNAGQALGDLTNVRQFITGNGLFAFFDAPWAPFYLAVIFMFSPWLGLFAVIAMVILGILAWATEVTTRKPLAEASMYASAANTFAANNLRNAEVIEAMGMLGNLKRRWLQRQLRFIALQNEASEKAGAITATTKTVRITVQSLVLGLGALLAIEGSITPGAMIAASILLGKALGPVEMAIGVWKQLLSARTAYHRLEKLLADNPKRPEAMQLPRPEGRLQVEGVSAMPPGSNNLVVRQVGFQVMPGQVLGIIGPSASGKSTLARLLVGIWPAAAGKVRLDGADVFLWDKAELGPAVGYLPQDIELFEGTIAENIARFGEVDAEKVVEAAKLAGVHEMILRFPKGYDTPIGESGSVLSGGQRQRIGFARAVYGNPSLVVLDEPNSNLDDAGEAALVQAVLALKARGVSVVLITHRTSIIAAVDLLALMADGMLQLFGPRDQVLQAIQQQNRQARQAQPAAPAATQTAALPAGAQ